MYAAVAQAAKVESGVAEARVHRLTPLPRIPKDKETVSKINSIRARYVAINKAARSVTTSCVKKMRGIEGTIEKTIKSAIQRERAEKDKDKPKKKKASGAAAKGDKAKKGKSGGKKKQASGRKKKSSASAW